MYDMLHIGASKTEKCLGNSCECETWFDCHHMISQCKKIFKSHCWKKRVKKKSVVWRRNVRVLDQALNFKRRGSVPKLWKNYFKISDNFHQNRHNCVTETSFSSTHTRTLDKHSKVLVSKPGPAVLQKTSKPNILIQTFTIFTTCEVPQNLRFLQCYKKLEHVTCQKLKIHVSITTKSNSRCFRSPVKDN